MDAQNAVQWSNKIFEQTPRNLIVPRAGFRHFWGSGKIKPEDLPTHSLHLTGHIMQCTNLPTNMLTKVLKYLFRAPCSHIACSSLKAALSVCKEPTERFWWVPRVKHESEHYVKSFTYYVEIKCQLDATDDIYCRFYCILNTFRAILCPSSGARDYYTDGRCLWYLVLWFSGYRYGVELEVMCPVCRLQTGHITWEPKHQIPQAATICIILSSSWWWA